MFVESISIRYRAFYLFHVIIELLCLAAKGMNFSHKVNKTKPMGKGLRQLEAGFALANGNALKSTLKL